MERKTLGDMLSCIDDARYNEQRMNMEQQYAKSFLALEGMWKPHEQGGLYKGWQRTDGYWSFGEFRYRSQPTKYNKLFNYLLSVALSGVIITHAYSVFHTAYNISCIFKYFQKPWANHTSLLESQKLAIPAIDMRPPLVRRWASQVEGIGVKRSAEAQLLFKTPIRLANSDEMDWMRLEGVGAPTAMDIVRQINGRSNR